MPLFESASLIVLLALAWLWFDSVKVRGSAICVARKACADEAYQFLDETVAITSLKLARDDDGRLLLRRIYGFEYSDTGNNRRPGSIVMLGQQVLHVHIGIRLATPPPILH